MVEPSGHRPDRRPARAVARPSPGRGPLGRWSRDLLRSNPGLDGLFARFKYLGAAVRPDPVPLHRSEGFRPLFIVGAGRSGNTLMRRILVAGGEIHIPPETYVLGTMVSLFRRSQHLGWRQQVHLALAQFEFHPEFEAFGIELRALANQLSSLVPDQRSLAALLAGFYRFHAASIGSAALRWGDKTPLNVYAMERLLRVFPDALFIHMVRDGVDVVASYVETGLMESFEDAAVRWTTSLRAAEKFAHSHPDRCLTVRYENLVSEPGAEAAAASAFSGLGFDGAQVNTLSHVATLGDIEARAHHSEATRPVHRGAIGKGRRGLSARDKRRLEPILGPVLRRWGYPPIG